MLHLDVIGDGARNVVLLHGCPSPPSHLEGLARALGARYRVHLVHYPGYGLSPAPTKPYTMHDASAWIEEALVERGVREAALVGHSAGAYRALHLVARAKLNWTAVVALSGFARPLPEQAESYRTFAKLLPTGVDFTSTLVDLLLYPALRDRSPELAREVGGWLRAVAPEALALELLAMTEAEDLRPILRDRLVPCLAVVGEKDHNQPPDRSREISEAMPNGTLRVLPGVGHLPLVEDFQTTYAAIADFLATSTARAEAGA